MKRHHIPAYMLLAAIAGLLAWIAVKINSFDGRISQIGLMLTEQRILNVPRQVQEASVDEDDSFSTGDSTAAVTAIMFFDYDCTYCKQFFVNTFPMIEEQLIRTGRLRFVFRYFPIEMHPGAYTAAQMAEQARQQGRFAGMHDRLMRTDLLSEETLEALAVELGVDTTGWRTNAQAAGKINADKRTGEDVFVRGTPAFVINGRMYTGMRDFEGFKEIAGLK